MEDHFHPPPKGTPPIEIFSRSRLGSRRSRYLSGLGEGRHVDPSSKPNETSTNRRHVQREKRDCTAKRRPMRYREVHQEEHQENSRPSGGA